MKSPVPELSEKALVQYVRYKAPRIEDVIIEQEGKKVVKSIKRRSAPIGVFVADKVPNMDGKTYTIKIGWSRCNRKDTFNRQTGLMIACNRLAVNRHKNVPHTMTKQFEKFIQRCEEYYGQPVQ